MKFSKWAIAALLVACAAAPFGAPHAQTAATPPTTVKPRPTPAPARPAAGQGTLDKIAAIVNDEVVLASDVEEQVALFLTRNRMQNPDPMLVDTLRTQILEQLVNEKLIVAEAKKQGLTVPDAELSREVDKAIADAKERLGEDGFRAQLAREGLTEEKLRARYRDEGRRTLLAQRLVNKQIPRRATPLPASEAEAYFASHPGAFPKAPAELRLSVIQIPALPDSATVQAARTKVASARRRIAAGEKFAKVAAEVSEDPNSSRSGGDLGMIVQGAFESSLEGPAFSLKINELSPPIRSPYGWHVLQVLERDTVRTNGRDSLGADGKPVLEAHVRHIMARVELSEADAQKAKTLADRVHGEARKGTDFATLVRRYSKYEGKQDAGGDLGFVSMGTLQPNIRSGLDSLEIGQVSDVLVNAVGFNIFKVTDRKPERPYTLEEIKDELPEAVQQIQYREKYDDWIASLRKKSHIEIR